MRKAFDLALKDLTRGFRSLFALAFMFVVPMLLTGIFYFAFGGILREDDSSGQMAKTRLIVVDQDLPSQDLSGMKTLYESLDAGDTLGSDFSSMGELLASIFVLPDMANLFEVMPLDSADAARTAVDTGEAHAALIIPADFTDRLFTGEAAQVEIYQDPTLQIGPAIVESIVNQFLDRYAALKVNFALLEETFSQSGIELTAAEQQSLTLEMITMEQAAAASAPKLYEVVSLEEAPTGSARFEDLLAMILSGMMIFFVFFTGTSTAQSLLDEQENGTLQRLFTMPMGPRVILRGKFIYIAVMIIVQMAVLLVLGRWVFDIHWGSWWQLMIFILVCTAASGSFGLFLMSLMRDSRQAGMIYGGALTVTGMLAMMPSFTGGTNQTAALERAALFVPQGWALRVLNQVRDGVSFEAVLLSLGGLLLWAVVFYVIARRRLERRFL